jgi:hypothetical protein
MNDKDLKLGEWLGVFVFVNAEKPVQGLAKSLKTPALVQSAQVFTQNISRAANLSMFPHSLFHAGRHFQVTQTLAVEPQAAISHTFDHFIQDVWDNVDTEVRPAFETLMSIQLVMVWTAFETLAGDLWEAAVNVHPHGLAQLAGKNKQGGQEKKDQGKMVQFSLLELYDFDLRTVMGTMQRNMEKVGFTTLDKIRGAYADAFGNESLATCKILDDSALDNLSIVRNVIVHKAGICDKEYRDKAENRPALPQLSTGDNLELDGRFVRQLVSPTVQCCVRLVQSVDDWLNGRLSAP